MHYRKGLSSLLFSYSFTTLHDFNLSMVTNSRGPHGKSSFNWVIRKVFVITKNLKTFQPIIWVVILPAWRRGGYEIFLWQLDEGFAVLYVCQINFRQVIFISFLWALISFCVRNGGRNDSTVMMSVKEMPDGNGKCSVMKFNLQLNNIERYWYDPPNNKYLQSPQPPQYIYWQRNDRMVNYDDNRRDVSIETIPGPRTQSRLNIKEPQISDSGNYTCRASNTEPASIYVYVSKGKNPFF